MRVDTLLIISCAEQCVMIKLKLETICHAPFLIDDRMKFSRGIWNHNHKELIDSLMSECSHSSIYFL